MDFYMKWSSMLNNDIECKKFINKFLNKEPETLDVFHSGTKDELAFACNLLLNIPIDKFIECIDVDKMCSCDMIFQYSNFEHATINVSKILKYVESPLTFAQIGKLLINAKEDGACRKYGENHSKLAKEMSMVFIDKSYISEVKNTSFGDFSVGLSETTRIELIRRLALRNNFIQKIVYYAKNGFVNYMELVCYILSESTAIRRKSNVKYITYLILKDNDLWNNIVW